MTRALPAFLLWLLATAAAAAEPSAAPFLWQAQRGDTTHYLMGSVHLLPPSAHPLPKGLHAAYAQAKGIVLESDIAELAAPAAQHKMLLAAQAKREGLKGEVPPALYRRLTKRAADLGMPMAMCDGFKPWFCALSLEVFNFQQAGFSSELGIDQHFYARAIEDGKAVRWLEEPEEHLRLFLEMPEGLSRQFLAATVEELTEAGKAPADLLRIWREGDVEGLARASADFHARHPEAYERLLAARNRIWLSRIDELLDGHGSQLVIVGAAHLAGPENLLDLMRERGYEIRAASD